MCPFNVSLQKKGWLPFLQIMSHVSSDYPGLIPSSSREYEMAIFLTIAIVILIIAGGMTLNLYLYKRKVLPPARKW
jgi:hypothetical protein